MKNLGLLFVGILLMAQATIQADGWDRVRQIFGADDEAPAQVITKVLIKDRTLGEMLEVTGSYNVYDPANNKKLGARFGDKRYFIQPTASGIKW